MHKILMMSVLFLTSSATAAVIADYRVTVDTGALAGIHYLDFQLIDGDSASGHSVKVSEVSLGGGQLLADSDSSAGVSGSLDTLLELSDISFFVYHSRAFIPGTELSFRFQVAGLDPALGIPDSFVFGLLDSSLMPLGTTGIANELLAVDLVAPLNFERFTTKPPSPLVSVKSIENLSTVPSVPEPRSSCLVVAGGLIALFRRRRRSAIN